jgi:hypothetical protein
MVSIAMIVLAPAAFMRGMSSGVHLVVKTDKGDVSVHLGPQWYLENQDVKIQPKDKVEVKGSRVTVQGQPAIIAAEVEKGGETLVLRDEAGVPMWAGWRAQGVHVAGAHLTNRVAVPESRKVGTSTSGGGSTRTSHAPRRTRCYLRPRGVAGAPCRRAQQVRTRK